MNLNKSKDFKTGEAFSKSWNNLPKESIYTFEQFKDWLAPLKEDDIKNKSVLELGCGNASLLFHLSKWHPSHITGVDLGESVLSAKEIMKRSKQQNWKIVKDDLTSYNNPIFDVVYSIGVLHHLKNPHEGFLSVVKNTKPGGKFHCWVYAYEGNSVVRLFVEPIRKIASKLPWWITKYFIATPLVVPFYLYAKFISAFSNIKIIKFLPLAEYSFWIAKRNFLFFRHVAFDQLVTPQTTYIKKETIQKWFRQNDNIDQDSCYIIRRNGNSWKFGGKKTNDANN